MTYTLRYNKCIGDVFDQPTWDVFDSRNDYAYKWVVKKSDGYRLAYNEQGRTVFCDPQPTKELALDFINALRIADLIEGKPNYTTYSSGA